MSIRKVIHCSDIHIRNFQRLEEYAEQLTKFVEYCRAIAQDYEEDEVRIVISGDLVHQKNSLSPELISFTSMFIRQLQDIAKVIVIAGNHDLIVNNLSRKDAISSIFETAMFENAFLLDAELGYQSGYVVDDNITWAVYSIYNDFLRPDIEKARMEHPDNKVVGLFHGMLVGASLFNNTIADNGCSLDMFEGCDCVMAGDIHKRQELRKNGVSIVYPGSLIQQTFGETVSDHGFAVWNMLHKPKFEFMNIENDYSLFDFKISSADDLDNDNILWRNE